MQALSSPAETGKKKLAALNDIHENETKTKKGGEGRRQNFFLLAVHFISIIVNEETEQKNKGKKKGQVVLKLRGNRVFHHSLKKDNGMKFIIIVFLVLCYLFANKTKR